ncbi:MAG: hypothetical protein ACT4QD_00070 [Acidobacteriota bacterium]
MTRQPIVVATLGGVLLGVAYTLSPLTVWFVVGCLLLGKTAVRGFAAEERRILLTLLIVAAALRLAVVGGLFAITDHDATPFGSLFGDEEYFKRRSLWLRSMALDVNISNADRIYAVDEYSDTSYLYWLAFIQVLVGAAPYGVHVFSIGLYLAGAVLLTHWIRRSFGQAPAVLSITLVLFMPTLFLWSVSALRESVHFLLTTTVLIGGLEAARRTAWAPRLLWGLVAVMAAAGLRDLRAGSMPIVVLAVASGIVGGWLARRPRTLAAAGALALVGVVAIGSRPSVQAELMSTIRSSAMNHQGHVFTPGLHYKLLEPRFYVERRTGIMDAMTPAEAARYVIRALVAAVVVPLPWHAQSRITQAYLPEHAVWLILAALAPVGAWYGWRYSPSGVFALVTYITLMGSAVALRSGNVGTLIRHRGLLLPFVMCLSAVAVCHVLARRRLVSAERAIADTASRQERTV